MNKKFVILLIALTLSGIGYAQTVQIDPRLEKAFSMEQLQRMQKESPITIELLNYELDYSWFIAEPDMMQKEDAIAIQQQGVLQGRQDWHHNRVLFKQGNVRNV